MRSMRLDDNELLTVVNGQSWHDKAALRKSTLGPNKRHRPEPKPDWLEGAGLREGSGFR